MRHSAQGVHKEYKNHADGSDTVVLFIHGIQGSPQQFDYMVDALKGTYSIQIYSFPGMAEP
jgi:esterase/lipase